MFINNINPVLFHLGSIEIRYYGLVYVIGFIVLYLTLRRIAVKHYVKNFKKEDVEELTLWVILGLLIGARFAAIFIFNPSYYFANPSEMLKIWHGGMAFLGGFVGAFFAGYLYCKKHKINLFKIADILVIPASLMLSLGRLANFTNSELYGIKTSVPWCVQFLNVPGCRHPTQIYEAIAYFFLFIFLLVIYNKKFNMSNFGIKKEKIKNLKKEKIKIKAIKAKPEKPGINFWTFGLGYGILRFIIGFWKDQPKHLLKIGQWWCLLLIALSIFFLWWIKRRKRLK